jgi:predicted Zn-ribbon and HTH transcriptional regulator
MWSLAQPILNKLLTQLNTKPEVLSESESTLARRICRCVLCSYFWVRKKGKLPTRCPNCHKRGWDTPFLSAIKAEYEQKAKGGQQ